MLLQTALVILRKQVMLPSMLMVRMLRKLPHRSKSCHKLHRLFNASISPSNPIPRIFNLKRAMFHNLEITQVKMSRIQEHITKAAKAVENLVKSCKCQDKSSRTQANDQVLTRRQLCNKTPMNRTTKIGEIIPSII